MLKESTKKKNKQVKTSWKDIPREFVKLRDKGYTIRQIAETEFLIDSKVRRFSIATISKTIKKHESSVDVTQDGSKHKDQDVVKVFKLLRKGWSLSRIVEKTNYHPDFVFKVAELYNKLENFEKIPKQTKEMLFSEATTISPCRTYDDLFEVLTEGIEAIEIVKKLVWKCQCCGKKYKIGNEEIAFIRESFAKDDWTCNRCLKKTTRDILMT